MYRCISILICFYMTDGRADINRLRMQGSRQRVEVDHPVWSQKSADGHQKWLLRLLLARELVHFCFPAMGLNNYFGFIAHRTSKSFWCDTLLSRSSFSDNIINAWYFSYKMPTIGTVYYFLLPDSFTKSKKLASESNQQAKTMKCRRALDL